MRRKDEWATKLAIKRETKGKQRARKQLITSSPLRVANPIFWRNQHHVRPFKFVTAESIFPKTISQIFEHIS